MENLEIATENIENLEVATEKFGNRDGRNLNMWKSRRRKFEKLEVATQKKIKNLENKLLNKLEAVPIINQMTTKDSETNFFP